MSDKPSAPVITDIVKQEPHEIIFSHGQHHFDALLWDIQHAKHSIQLEMYTFNRDHLGKIVADALCDAAERGVDVKVMVDGCGTPHWGSSFAKQLEKAGAQTKVFHPFPWQLWNWSRSAVKLPILLKWIYLALKSNSRNHRKVCIIDNHIAYVGSVNISKHHLNANNGGDDWRDTSIKLVHCDVSDLQRAFDNAWSHRTIKERIRDTFRHIKRNPLIRLNHSRHRRRILYKNLLRRIQRTQKRIWITNAYFVPDNFLLRRLKEAARLGVDVRILLPSKSDVMMMPWASSAFYYSLLKDGVRIFEYLPSNLHAKTLILDDWALIGSSNLNHRSLLHDLEADINVTKLESIATLQHSFLNDLKQSREISLEHWHKHRPLRQRFMGRLLLYMKYWI